MKRRQFLISNLALLGSGVLPGIALGKTSLVESRGLPPLAGALTRQNLAAYRGEKFLVYGAEGAREVEVLHQRVNLGAGPDVPGPVDDQRRGERGLVHPSLVVPAVFAQIKTLIRGINYNGIFC